MLPVHRSGILVLSLRLSAGIFWSDIGPLIERSASVWVGLGAGRLGLRNGENRSSGKRISPKMTRFVPIFSRFMADVGCV